jgi:hypothetical protein
MNERFRFDAEDPFGTRPDEKPPAGWDEKFWDDVRERIQQRQGDPGSTRLPEPPRRANSTARAVAIIACAVATAAGAAALYMTSFPAGPDRHHGRGADATTTVIVSGAGDPAVAVEWARSGGQASGYVVLESFAPEISYVVIDSHLANPPAPQP